MIEVLSKPVDQIGIRDVESLITSEVPEGEQIEFKEELPAKRDGSPDPWMSGGVIGDRAKNEILEEVVAFANAHGGALLLGIRESNTKPSVAASISPIPRCAELAERLKLVFRDCVEPQLTRIDVFAVPTNAETGVVIVRAGRSRLAPHRVTRTLACPVRRSDRCEKMTMREIQDMTLNVARGLERLERRLLERSERFQQEFDRLETPDDAFGIRLTAAPIGDEIQFDRVFHQSKLIQEFDISWRTVSRQSVKGEQNLESPLDFSPLYWRPILRGARGEIDPGPVRVNQPHVGYGELHCDGLIELGFLSAGSHFRTFCFPPDWPTVMFANLAVWADHIRKQALAPTTEYALEVEIRTLGAQILVGHNNIFSQARFAGASGLRETYPRLSNLMFPRYLLNSPDEISKLLALFERDFWNSLGKDVGTEEGTFSIEGWPS